MPTCGAGAASNGYDGNLCHMWVAWYFIPPRSCSCRWWRCPFQTPGMCLEKKQVANTHTGLTEHQQTTLIRLYFLFPFFSISFYADTITVTVTQILCHTKAVACPVPFTGRNGADVVKSLGWVFILAATRIHCKLAGHRIAKVSNENRGLALCICSHRTHIMEENRHDG